METLWLAGTSEGPVMPWVTSPHLCGSWRDRKHLTELIMKFGLVTVIQASQLGHMLCLMY